MIHDPASDEALDIGAILKEAAEAEGTVPAREVRIKAEALKASGTSAPELLAAFGPDGPYDPRVDGADCDRCPMKRWGLTGSEGWTPVRGSYTRGQPSGLLLAEAPVATEVQGGEPLIGESGRELDAALRDVGIDRSAYDVDNVISCRAPGNRWDAIADRLRKDAAADRALAHEQHPSVHCRPRLLRILRRSRNIIALGGKAAAAILGGAPSILAIRGGPAETILPEDHTEGRIVRVLPTLHPAFVRRKRRWRLVFRADLRKALRLFTNTLTWVPPKYIVEPTPAELKEFLAQPSRYWSFDVETAKGPSALWISRAEGAAFPLYCIGIGRDATPAERAAYGTDVVSIVVPVKSIGYEDPERAAEGPPWWGTKEVQEAYAAALRAAFTDGRLWVAHNYPYDRTTIEQCYGVTPRPWKDTILYCRLNWPELGKALGIVGSILTDAVAWKQDNEGNKLATESRSNEQLWDYNACAGDIPVTHRIFPLLVEGARQRGQCDPCPARPDLTLDQLDHWKQANCIGMARVGMRIDIPAAIAFHDQLSAEAAAAAKDVIRMLPKAAYREDFNPASFPQVKDVMYGSKGWALEPEVFTELGEPSTGDPAIREYLMKPGLRPELEAWLRAMRTFRTKDRDRAMAKSLRPRSAGGWIDPDGRLRVSWSAHTPAPGRVASSDPTNMQNLKKSFRKLVIPEEGHALIGSDYDALHARLHAGLWGLKKYVEAFSLGQDTHQITMELCYGDRIWTMKGAPPPGRRYFKTWAPGPWGPGGAMVEGSEIGGTFSDDIRSICKRWYYGAAYEAGDLTVWRLLREAEDDDGNFIYAKLKLGAVKAMSRRFHQALPEMRIAWNRIHEEFKAKGYLRDALSGRRCDFLDGVDADVQKFKSDLVNWTILPAEAFLLGVAEHDLLRHGLTANCMGHGTGILQDGHDALLVEVPVNKAEEVRRMVEHYMTQEYPHIAPGVRFTATAKVSTKNWKAVC